jgi:hypothetical protein
MKGGGDMAIRPLYLKAAPTTTPAPFGLLATFPAQTMPAHGSMAGIEYDTEFCGVARPWDATACLAPNLGTVSVSVDTASVATITGTGEPAGNYVVDWDDGAPGAAAPLDGQSHDYTTAGDGDYQVSVTGPDGYSVPAFLVVVEDGVATGPFQNVAVAEKVADDGVSQTTGVPIVLYHLFTCRLIGDTGDPVQRARRSLELGASRALEEGFGDVIGADATDITPSGTAVGVIEGLALAEQYGGENYGGRRVIHADNAVVTYLISQGLVIVTGGHLETLLGSTVVAGPGYADSTGPSAPAAGAHWMYVTGAVNVWKQEIKVDEIALEMPYTNEFKALAEQIYVPTYECFAAAVEVTLEA